MASEEEEKIIEEFMGDDGRAQQWRAMRESLQDRLKALRAERATTLPDAISSLDRRIAQIVEQVRVLETEEAVSQFVEDSVRATLRSSVMRGPNNLDDDEEE